MFAHSLPCSARASDLPTDPVDLQLDYWTLDNGGHNSVSTKKGTVDSGMKNSIKTSIRYMVIQRSHSNGTLSDSATFNMQYWVKEKKQKSK